MNQQYKPIILIILDGWGYNKSTDHNAIAHANTPYWDHWWHTYPHMLISGSGIDVGLPPGQMGNSEVGHMHIGAGRVIQQDFSRINQAIESKQFFDNTCFIGACQQAKAKNSTIHILGLLSPGGVHSHENHIFALIDLARHYQVKLRINAILDGRYTPPRSAKSSLLRLEDHLKSYENGIISTVSGRYYAMDRDNRWDRVEKAYMAIAHGQANYHADNALDALAKAYEPHENDEFVQPTIINTTQDLAIENNDTVIFMNFRSDSARQLTRTFT